jgi:hypothetical protein
MSESRKNRTIELAQQRCPPEYSKMSAGLPVAIGYLTQESLRFNRLCICANLPRVTPICAFTERTRCRGEATMAPRTARVGKTACGCPPLSQRPRGSPTSLFPGGAGRRGQAGSAPFRSALPTRSHRMNGTGSRVKACRRFLAALRGERPLLERKGRRTRRAQRPGKMQLSAQPQPASDSIA